MSDSEARALASRPEGPHLEHELSFRPEVARHLVGMLNSGGGTLVIGVGPDGQPVGVAKPAQVQRQIREVLDRAVHPRAPFSIRRLPTGRASREVIVVDVPAGPETPYVFESSIVIREAEGTRDARREEITELIQRAAHRQTRWESQPGLGVEIGHLDATEILRTAELAQRHRYINLGREPSEILDSLQLIADGHVTNGAVVLFGRTPSRSLPQTRVRVARFEGGGTTVASDQRVLEGNLFELLDAVEEFLQRHLAIGTEKPGSGFQRTERASLPQPVAREALLNALSHRDYAAYSGGIRLGLWDDRLELWNSGALPDEIPPSELPGSHASRPRNPNIANVLFLRGLVEGYGTGTTLIAEALQELGLPAPEWQNLSGGTELRIRFGATRPVGDLLPRERRLLSSLRAGAEIRARDYEVAVDVTSRQARTDLRKLVDAGYLERAGKGRATRYVRTGKRVE